VGDPNQFTPLGLEQVGKVAPRLSSLHFDFIAVSPFWRTRNTILPYLLSTQTKAEIWPELGEFAGISVTFLGKPDLPPPEKDLYKGRVIELPQNERGAFLLRDDRPREFHVPKAGPQAGANLEAILGQAITQLKERFAGSNKTVLLVGHGNSGKALLQRLINQKLPPKLVMENVSLWMVEEQNDGSFALKVFNNAPYLAAKAEEQQSSGPEVPEVTK
jgi:broad specificity phosphatase PhoE